MEQMNKMNNGEKCFFAPGDKVQCNKLDNSPTMYVLRKKELTFKDGEAHTKTLQGFVCRWFTNDGQIQEGIFNSKDLQKI